MTTNINIYFHVICKGAYTLGQQLVALLHACWQQCADPLPTKPCICPAVE